MGFRRNLSVAEIACQVREVMLLDAALKPTNVVFMGMGEPLLNWDAVDRALTILNHAEALGIGARHITVSTVGILPNLAKLAQRPEQFRLALSLHAPTPELRDELMPLEKKYKLPAVLAAPQRPPWGARSHRVAGRCRAARRPDPGPTPAARAAPPPRCPDARRCASNRAPPLSPARCHR